MLTKRQLEDMAKNYGTEVLDIDIPGIKAAKTALAYREMLEKVTNALVEAMEVISEELDIVNKEDLALIVDASMLLRKSEVKHNG